MKLTYLFACILGLITCTYSHKSNHVNFSEIAVADDVTDKRSLYPIADPILREFYLEEDKNRAAIFHYTVINNLSLVPVITLKLPDKQVTDNQNKYNTPFFRENLILGFYDSVRSILKTSQSIQKTVSESQCFKTICSQLTILAESKSDHKILCIYSNLFENSSLISLYDLKIQKQLYQSPNTIEAVFENSKQLPINLTGITVLFIYKPLNPTDDKLYNAIVSVYKSLLQRRGAKCIVQASNKSFDL